MKEEEGVYLKELNIYIIKLLDYLWVEPKLVANLLLCAKKEDIENNLSPLIGNFFYENIISPDYIQDKLLYVITYLLKNEIMNLNSKTDYGIFLDNTSAGFLINELIKYEYEFKEYFRRIIIKTIEKLEIEYSRMKLNFIIPYKIIDNDKDDTLAEEAEIDKAYCENQLIINNYFVNFKKDYIEKEKQKHQNDNGKNIYDEYLNMINNDHLKKYDNKLFFESLEIDENLKKSYIHNFCLVVDCIDQIISDFLINLNAFPHSLKCIGKIISELIQQRFPDITIKEKNAFIGKYIFMKILMPLFCEKQKVEVLATGCLIFENTIYNANKISQIFKKLIFGELYSTEDFHYSSFNLFFIEKINDIVKICDIVTRVKLPDFIDKFLYDKFEDDFDFSNEDLNKDEIISNKLICFQFDDILAIIDTMSNNQNLFFNGNKNIGLKKTLEKLTNENSKELIKEIIESDEYILSLKNLKQNLDLKKVFYFYITKFTINKKYEKYFKLESDSHIISSTLLGASEEEKIKTNIKKVKDCICSILENYQTLSEKRYLEENIKDTKSIFEEIQRNSYLNNYLINSTIPSRWYLSSLFQYLELLPEKYIDNDYELLFSEIEKETNDFIKFLNFEFLAEFKEKQVFSKNNLDNYEKLKKKVNYRGINKKIQKIITNDFIPVVLYFNYNEKILELKTNTNIKQEQFCDKDIIINTEKNRAFKYCKTIEAFTKAFPNLSKYEIIQDENVLELLEKLGLSQKLKEYNNLIKLHLSKIIPESKDSYFEYSLNRLNDYIMSRIHDKIFPKTEEKDDKIYKQCVYLSWTEPKHFIPENKLFNLEGIKQDLNKYLTQFQDRKSPMIKQKNLLKIFKLISDAARFNGYIIKDTDDNMDILSYLIIKAKPMKLYSNCKFSELFLFNKENKKEDSELAQLISICEFICNMEYNKLINVSSEEYKIKCRKAAENDLSH